MADRIAGVVESRLRRSAYVRARRRSALRGRFVSPSHIEGPAAGYEPVRQILQDILESACEVMGSGQAFILVSRGRAALDVAATYAIDAGEVTQTVLAQCARAVNASMLEKIMTAGDLHGYVLPMREGAGEEHAPAVLCVPLELNHQQGGVICLLRSQQARRMSDLDLEIVQALAEQASLAIGAASHHSALSRLQDSLSSFAHA